MVLLASCRLICPTSDQDVMQEALLSPHGLGIRLAAEVHAPVRPDHPLLLKLVLFNKSDRPVLIFPDRVWCGDNIQFRCLSKAQALFEVQNSGLVTGVAFEDWIVERQLQWLEPPAARVLNPSAEVTILLDCFPVGIRAFGDETISKLHGDLFLQARFSGWQYLALQYSESREGVVPVWTNVVLSNPIAIAIDKTD